MYSTDIETRTVYRGSSNLAPHPTNSVQQQ